MQQNLYVLTSHMKRVQTNTCVAAVMSCAMYMIVYYFLSVKLLMYMNVYVILLFGLSDWFSAATVHGHVSLITGINYVGFSGVVWIRRSHSCIENSFLLFAYIVLLFEKYMYTGSSEILFAIPNKSIACICRMREETFH